MHPHPAHAKTHQEGFTLIELMITVALIGILAAIAMSLYTASTARGFNDQAKGDLMSAVWDQERWFADNNSYTPNPTIPNVIYKISPDGNSFNACAKHLRGDKIYGYDSDTRQYRQQDSAIDTALADCPAATPGDDFVGWQPMQ